MNRDILSMLAFCGDRGSLKDRKAMDYLQLMAPTSELDESSVSMIDYFLTRREHD